MNRANDRDARNQLAGGNLSLLTPAPPQPTTQQTRSGSSYWSLHLSSGQVSSTFWKNLSSQSSLEMACDVDVTVTPQGFKKTLTEKETRAPNLRIKHTLKSYQYRIVQHVCMCVCVHVCKEPAIMLLLSWRKERGWENILFSSQETENCSVTTELPKSSLGFFHTIFWIS